MISSLPVLNNLTLSLESLIKDSLNSTVYKLSETLPTLYSLTVYGIPIQVISKLPKGHSTMTAANGWSNLGRPVSNPPRQLILTYLTHVQVIFQIIHIVSDNMHICLCLFVWCYAPLRKKINLSHDVSSGSF